MFAFLSSSKLKENLTELHIIVRTTGSDLFSTIFFSSSKSVVSYSGSDVFIFSNQIRTFYEGSKLSQMKQDIAKSRVKYGGTRFKGILPSDKTKIRKYFILSQISWVNILKLIFLHNLKFLSSRKGPEG